MRPLTLLVSVCLSVGCSSDNLTPEPPIVCQNCGDSDAQADSEVEFDSRLDVGDISEDLDEGRLDRLSEFYPTLRLDEERVLGTSRRIYEDSQFSTALVVKSVGEEFVYDTRVDYLDEEPFVQNSTQIRPKIWGANRLLVAFDSIGIVAEYTLNPEPRKVDELVVGDHLYGLYQYGSQIVAFGEDYITFIESTVLGMEITKQISREAKPFDDFGTHDDQQYIVGDVLYDVQRTLDSESVLVAWDLLATSSNQALLGVSEPAPHSDINVSGSTRHEIAASVGNRERAIALFSMTVPPEYLGSLSLEDFMTNPNASARHVISGDWLLVTISVAGGSDEGYFVFDISKEPLECLGQVQDGEFNEFGSTNVDFVALNDEIFVLEEAPQVDPRDEIYMQSFSRSDFVLGPCP